MAKARLNIRFNDLHRGADLVARIEGIVKKHAPAGRLRGRISGEAFLTQPGPLSALVSEAILETLGRTPELSTSGGTSDARFLVALAPTVEFGLNNATMHKLDEAVAAEDLRALAGAYARILAKALV